MPKRAIPAPRLSCARRSEMEAPPNVTGQTPKQPAKNRNTINCSMLLATAHAMVKMMKNTLQTTYTGYRPYISDKGEMTKGPTAKPRMYIETTSSAIVVALVRNSRRTSGTPGANMLDASGVRKVRTMTSAALVIFAFDVQFIGFEESSGPSQVTMF